MKKALPCFLIITILINIVASIPLTIMADNSLTFEYDSYTVDYKIVNSWGNGQYNNVTVSIKNTGTETIENWMLAYDFMGDATMQSGGKIFETEEGITYVKNTGDNLAGYGDSLNIDPGKSVNFSYSLTNPTGTPDSFILCQERVALVNGVDYEVTLNPQYDYGNSFQGEIKIKNLTDKPIECWELTFSSSNFTLQNSWDRTLVDHGDGKYTIKPVAGGIIRVNPKSTLTFGFQANKSSAVAFANLDFNVEGMTEVVFNGIPENGIDIPETPEIPEDLDVLIAIGAYNEEDNSILLEWSYKDTNGVFDIYEISNGKTLVASVTDGTSYTFEVDNTVDEYIFIVEKYISDVEILISNEVIMQKGENGLEFVYVDSDEDGLPDIYEHILGTDPNEPDTDGDDLPDGYEVFTLGTDPTLPDTDDNGISDADEDFDDDSLINLEEYQIETDPFDPDTDGDRLIDSEDAHPLDPDFDKDLILDGDEAELGFDNESQDTDGDGIIDGEEHVLQTVKKDVETFDGAISKISVEMDATNNLNTTLEVKSVYGTDMMSSNVVGLVGEPFDFSTTSEFNEAKITFYFDDIGENTLDNLLFLWYDEENHNYQELETTYDVENNSVSTVTTHFSKYMIVNANVWFSLWSDNLYSDVGYNDLPYNNNTSGIAYSVPSSKAAALALSKSYGYIDDYSNYLLIETSNLTWQQANEYCISLGGHLATINSVAENSFVWNLINSGSKTVYWIGGIWDAYNSPRWVTGEEFGSSVLSLGDLLGPSTSGNLCGRRLGTQTANQTINTWYKGATPNVIENYKPISFVCEWNKEMTLVDTDEDGLADVFETKGMRLENGEKICSNPNTKHSDTDGLEDGQEILPQLKEKKVYTDASSFHIEHYFVMISNPNKEDSDDDGILDWLDNNLDKNVYYKDSYDTAPLQKGLIGGVIGELTIISYNLDNKLDGGHAWIMYKSYVNDNLDFKNFAAGFKYYNNYDNDNWRIYEPNKYIISPNKFVSIGNFDYGGVGSSGSSGAGSGASGNSSSGNSQSGSSSGDGASAGIHFNMEFNMIYDDNDNDGNRDRDYNNNIAITKVIKIEQLKTMLEYCNSVNHYNLIANNCSEIASIAWNKAFNDDIKARSNSGVFLPSTLKKNIEKRENAYSINFYDDEWETIINREVVNWFGG